MTVTTNLPAVRAGAAIERQRTDRASDVRTQHTSHPITISTNVMAVLAGTAGVGAVAAEWTGNEDLRSWLVIAALLLIGLALCGLSDDYARRKRTDKTLSKINTA